jgi:type IV pilus assembly protein PilA
MIRLFHNMKKREGFTLIELMIVVAIIGILAAIAIPNFLRFQLRSKAGEGKVNLAAIRTAEEGYYAEYSTYVETTVQSPRDEATLTGAAGAQKFVWADLGGFGEMGFEPEGDVYYTYAAEAGPTPGTPPFTEYLASAVSNIDGDTAPDLNAWGYVKPIPGSSTFSVGDSAWGGANGCVAAGVYNSQTQAQDAIETVGPCAAGNGQSRF